MDGLIVGILFGIGIGLLLRPAFDWWIASRHHRLASARLQEQYGEFSFDESEVPSDWK
jgi:hypothetical protein